MINPLRTILKRPHYALEVMPVCVRWYPESFYIEDDVLPTGLSTLHDQTRTAKAAAAADHR